MAAPVIYRSTDTSAPVLTGQVGSLITLLDACLVNGYGSKAAAGWTKAFTTTNGAAYRQGGSGFYWEVNDNAAGTGGAQEARTRGYETMSAFGTGTGLFPTVAQVATGIIVRKSSTASSTARAWTVVADDKTVLLLLLTADFAGVYLNTMFGDFFSYMSGDAYKKLIAGRTVENSATTSNDNFGTTVGMSGSVAGHYVPRTYTGFGTSVAVGKHVDSPKAGNSSAGNFVGVITFPNPVDGGLYISPVSVHEPTSTLRGRLRGVYQGCHPLASFGDGDTFDGMGAYAGRSFLIAKTIGGGTGNVGYLVIETTVWDTSP